MDIDLQTAFEGWAKQFQETDQDTALLLLRSLSFISANDFNSNLAKLINSVAHQLPKPVALIPVREQGSKQSYFSNKNGRNGGIKMYSETSHIGSEGLCGNLIKNLCRSSPSIFVKATPTLPHLRASKARSVIFVDDFVGSGKRCTDFLNSFNRHSTIKSWRSGSFLKNFSICSYSATRQGEKLVTSHWYKPAFHKVLNCPTLNNIPLTSKQVEDIQDLCRRYAEDNDMALGFQQSGGLLLFRHKAPNNLPSILWKKGKGTEPLFPDGAIPVTLQELFSETITPIGIREVLSSIGQDRLALGEWIENSPTLEPELVLVLSAINSRATSVHAITDRTFLPLFKVQALLDVAKFLDLISDNNRLTRMGHKELDRLRNYRHRSSTPKITPSNASPYFPRSLK